MIDPLWPWIRPHLIATFFVFGVVPPLLCTLVFLGLKNGTAPTKFVALQLIVPLALGILAGLIGVASVAPFACGGDWPDCANFYLALWMPFEFFGLILGVLAFAAWWGASVDKISRRPPSADRAA